MNANTLKTAAELLNEARTALREVEDAEWDDPTPDNVRLVHFWTGQVTMLSAIDEDTLIPLF